MTDAIMTPRERTEQYCNAFLDGTGFTLADIQSWNKKADITQARRELAYHLVEQKGWTCAVVGRLLKRDRTTVLSACAREHMLRTGEVRPVLSTRGRRFPSSSKWTGVRFNVGQFAPLT